MCAASRLGRGRHRGSVDVICYVMLFCYLFVLYLPPSSLIAQCLCEELLDFKMLYEQAAIIMSLLTPEYDGP